MNKYLLLRDNKQSGPYSVGELATHGLKPYDLVWLEGRSAAWRYPSEIDELKPFAPIVEEQPFDRFYRKPELKTVEGISKDNTRVQQNQFAQTEIKKTVDPIAVSQQVILNNGSKKIHVSFPGNAASSLNEKPISEEQPRPSITATEAYVNTATSSQLNNSVKEVPVPNSDKEKFIQPFSNIDSPSSVNLEKAYKKIKQGDITKVASPVHEKPVSKFLFRSVAAACLLLGGALIGLIINYSSQQKKFQQLNQLVQEIKQQDNPGVSKTVKNDQLSAAALPTSTESDFIPTENAVEQVYKEELELPPAKKDKKPAKPGKSTADSAALPQQHQEAVPAVMESTEPVHKIDKVASDLAKKNLWQLVTVDHNKYKTGVFGGVSNLSIKLSNKSLLQLEQVEVEVLFLSPEKKTVNKQKIVFENVSPGEQLQIDVPKSSRGVKVEYSIKKIITKEFELAHAGM